MPTCGYTCPQCEGRGYTEDMEVCDWCSEIKDKTADDGDGANITDTENEPHE